MGCRCCRMMKSYISEPSAAVDVRKSDSLYHTHQLSGGGRSLRAQHKEDKEGVHNLAYSISGDLRLERDNNHVNHRLHAAPPPSKRASAPPAAEGALYIIRPDALGPHWVRQDKRHGQVPVYPAFRAYDNHTVLGGPRPWDGPVATDEVDEGVGGTPEYTGDEESVLSADLRTGTASLCSADSGDERSSKAADASTVESGIGGTKSEDEGSVTDSMVAEALAALEAATAGEE